MPPESGKRVRPFSLLLDHSTERSDATPATSLPIQQVPERKNDPFTDQFFLSMRSKIGEVFPIEAFAQEQNCSVSDVRDALSAVFLAPLEIPLEIPQVWHGAKSVSEYGKILIGKWRACHDVMMDQTGRADNPIYITDSSTCNTPAPKSEPREGFTNSEIMLDDTWVKTASVMPNTFSRPISDRPRILSPQIKREVPTARVPARLDVYGSWVPVHKWIEGVHKPRVIISDDLFLTDEEMDALMQNGYFDEEL